MCLRCEKSVKSISGLTRHINAYKIPISLLSCQLSKPIAILENNTTICSNLPSDNNKENISPGVSNHDEEGIKPVNNNNEDIRLADID